MASENLNSVPSEVKIGASVAFKEIIKITLDNNQKKVGSTIIDFRVPQEESLNEKSPEVNLSSPGGKVPMDDDSATVETETDSELKKSISDLKTAINETHDEKNLMNDQSRPLTIEKFEKIEHEKRKQKKALKRLARQQFQLEVVNEDQLSSMDVSLIDENELAKASIVTYDDLFLLELESSSSISTSSSEGSDSEVSSIPFNGDFLKVFAKLPDIDEISSVTEEQTSVLDKDLSGKFVDPLTGETDTTTTNMDLDDTDLLEEDTHHYIENEDSEIELSDIVFPVEDKDFVPRIDMGRSTPQLRGIRSELNFLRNFEFSPVCSKSSSTLADQQQNRISSFDLVKHFIEKLINTVVVNETTKESMENLSVKLDKSKLMNELSEVWTTLNVEMIYNDNIQLKTVEYYRRIHQTWAVTPQPLKSELMDYRRYKYLLNILDHLRQKAASTKKRVMYTIDSIISELQSAQYFSNVTADKLEDRMRKTIAPLESKKMEQSLEADIKQMQDLRNQIGEERMKLLRQNDTLASSQRRLLDYDPIEPDCSMTQYINIQHDIFKLGKLLEARSISFDRMYERFDNYIKRVAFYREKTDITAAILKEQKDRLKELYLMRDKLRRRLNQLHLEHNRSMAEKTELELKAGIFRSPFLMLDYDKCLELVSEKRKVVLELRNRVQKLGSRLAKICAHNQALC
ncbi:uncharacterized protein LOC111518518 [Drosophila willistoni]|uniref:uncharacterized protein LOC111518518 n=1 Tax=Drosophila willistoni TaxID=7260 RepID=UPI000C26D372|nr:uncharacterized protein LOC111518518 [Drosophila willistoni]